MYPRSRARILTTAVAAVVVGAVPLLTAPSATAAPPTATLMLSDSALKAGETATLTVAFSEAVTGVEVGDFAVANGALSGLATSDNVTYTATLTPQPDVESHDNVIVLDNSSVQAGGVPGTGTSTSSGYAVDTRRPTADLDLADNALAAHESTTVTITTSEPVTGLDAAAFSVPDGAGSLTDVTGSGTRWTATLTAPAPAPAPATGDSTANLVTLDNTELTDAAGNTGTGTTTSSPYAIDSTAPGTNSITLTDTALRAGETATITVTFSERVAGFTVSDLAVANATVGEVTSADSGRTWTATLTPGANVNDTSNVVTLDGSRVADLAGNAGSGTAHSANYAIETTRPTATIAVTDDALAIGQTSPVRITFSEPVTGLTNADLTVANGTLSAVTGTGTTWTATLTPSATANDDTNVITLDNAGVTDTAGNTGVGISTSNNYRVDTTRPTATIVVADNALAIGQTSLVTVTFSEPVTGFANADLTVANGTLSTLTGSGTTWTATLTPTATANDDTNVITLANNGVTDTAGNAGAGTTTSNNYVIDTARPTASIVVADAALAAGETSPVTITFSERVTGFTNADLAVGSGTLGTVGSSDGGTTWTAVLTPDEITDLANEITLALAGVADAAGNTGSGIATSNSYAIDAFAPESQAAAPALSGSRTWTVTYTVDDESLQVAAVDLYARGPGQPAYLKVASDTVDQDGTFRFSGTDDGAYSFYTVATDAMGNVETAPASSDVDTVLDDTAPGLVSRTRRPAVLDLGRGAPLELRVQVDERATLSFTIVDGDGTRVRGLRTLRSATGNVSRPWNGRDDRGRRVEPGRYRAVVVATDDAGNRSRVAIAVRVTG